MSITHWWDRSVHGIPVVREIFIETGCKAGDTLWQAKDKFPTCHSIEINGAAYAACLDRFRDFPHVQIHLGDSRDVLPRIIDPTRPTTFYLDAHCEGAPSTVPEADTECPLLDELDIIVYARWTTRPTIIIDDIHMFHPGYWRDPHSNWRLFTPADWPRFEQICELLADYRFHEDTENRVGLWV